MKKPYHPQKLPLKNLNWESFIEVLGKAHHTLGCFDQMLHQKAFLPALQEESLFSLQTHQKSKTTVIEISNYRAALLWGSKVIKTAPFSTALFCRMHRLIKKGSTVSQDLGKFRRRQNWIGPEGCDRKEAYFFPPSYEAVPQWMNNLKEYLNSHEKDPLIQLAVSFAQFMVIHPFMDGNGRLARALIPIFLFKKKVLSKPVFYMSHYFKKHRLIYLEKLFLISEKGDWEGWICFFLEGIIEEGHRLLKRVDSTL